MALGGFSVVVERTKEGKAVFGNIGILDSVFPAGIYLVLGYRWVGTSCYFFMGGERVACC